MQLLYHPACLNSFFSQTCDRSKKSISAVCLFCIDMIFRFKTNIYKLFSCIFLKQDKYKNEPPNAIDLFKVLHCSSKTGFTEHVKEVIVSSCSVLFPFLVMHLINLACTLAYVFSCLWIHGC